MKFLKFLNRYIKPYYREVVISLALNLIAIVFSAVSITMLIPFLQVLFGRVKPVSELPDFRFSGEFLMELFSYYLGKWIEEKGSLYALGMICLVSVIIFFLKNLFRYLALYVFSKVRTRFLFEMRSRMYEKILSLPVLAFSRLRRGDVLSRFTADIHEVEWAIVNSLEVLFKEPLTIISYVSLMVMISWKLTMFVLIVLGLAGLIIGVIGRKLKQESAEAQHYTGLLASIVEETLRGVTVIKVFGAERYVKRIFFRIHRLLDKVRLASLRRRELSSPLSEFLGICAVVVVLWFGGREVLMGRGLPPETFITFIVIFSQLINPAKSFATAYYHVQRGMAAAERIESLLKLDSRLSYSIQTGNVNPPVHFGKIEYRGVWVAYSGSKYVLKDITLTLRKPELVVVVGPSGSGKTTLVHLLPLFVTPVRGEITVDGTPLSVFKLSEWRKLISYVPQDPVLFYDTVRNNIRIAKPEASDEEIVNAARLASAHEFISKLERGYDTHVGEAGSRLSAGEKQRIAIARAFLKPAPILILDEATANLDVHTEAQLIANIKREFSDRLVIIIAHRLQIARHADRIIVMQDGKIVEIGTHEELIKKDGVYARMVSKQQAG